MDKGDSSCGNDDSGSPSFVLIQVLGRLPQQVISTIVIVLAVGFVLTALLFVYLSFLYPSRIAMVLGALTPGVVMLTHLPKVIKRIQKKDGNPPV